MTRSHTQLFKGTVQPNMKVPLKGTVHPKTNTTMVVMGGQDLSKYLSLCSTAKRHFGTQG